MVDNNNPQAQVTWRCMSDALKPEQIEQLEAWEANHRNGIDNDTRREFLGLAADMIRENVNNAEHFGHLAAPAGAVKVYAAAGNDDGIWSREFTGTRVEVAGVSAVIEGTQYATGLAERHITVLVDDLPQGLGGTLTAEGAHQFGKRLIELARESAHLDAEDETY